MLSIANNELLKYMDIIEQTKKIAKDDLAKYRALIFGMSVKKKKIAKEIMDRINKNQIEDLRNTLKNIDGKK